MESVMRKIQICILALTAVFATGCPKYSPKVDFQNPSSLVAKINTHIDGKRKLYEDALAANPPNTARAKQIRNELIEDALPYLDGAYTDFITDIQAGRDRANFIADVVDLGTAGAVGITKGERTLQIIGVALTAFRGGRKSADANFYKDQSTPILISKMDGNRAKVRSEILDREKLEVTDYQLGAAIADIVAYYNAGTLVRAFTQLQQDTAIATQASEQALTDAKRAAGIRGAVPAATLAASKEFSAAIRDHRTAFFAAKTNIATEDGKLNAANQAITAADTAISLADQAIGRAQGEVDKAKADAAKAKAEKDKIQATTDKQAAETAKAAATKARDEELDKLRGIFDAIAADSKLSPLLNKSI
jgi:hypothetical protein